VATTVKLSSKFQIVIPKQARKSMALAAGDRLLVLVKPDRVVLIPRPKSYTKRLAGLHSSIWTEPGAANYLKDERDSW
jgi:AbrB family looped-hinge helix DNA binding protein